MAIFPCDEGPHKHSGKNINVYIGLIRDGDPLRYSTRLCDLHWGEIEPHLTHYEVLVDDPTASFRNDAGRCASCGDPLTERGQQLFITAYPPKHDRKDYWLHIHSHCTVPRFIPAELRRAGA